MAIDSNITAMVVVGAGCLAQLAGGLIWGARIDNRVKTLELSKPADLGVAIARVEEKLTGLGKRFDDLNASIRWMREPAQPWQTAPPDERPTPPRRRGNANS